MGRKSKKDPAAAKKLSPNKQNELNVLISALLKLGFLQTINQSEQFQQFLEIQSLLERITLIESEISILKSGKTGRLASISRFTRFMEENGAKFDGLSIAEFPGYELGLKAERDFKDGEVFITIPEKLLFSYDKADGKLEEMIKDVPILELPNIRLAFFLAQERLKGEQSFWKPYFDVLPEKYSTVLYFKRDELEELRGSVAFGPALTQVKNIARQYAVLYKAFQMKEDETFGRFTYDLYAWAASTVMTRQNLVPGDERERVALIPLWDMVNHTNGTITTNYNLEDRCVESFTLSECRKGEQIFIFYGARNSMELLIHNGFVYPENRNESIPIKLSLSPADKLFKERTALLEKLGVIQGEFDLLPPPDYISSHLLAFIRVFCMTKEELDHWLATEGTQAQGLLHPDCALSTEAENKAWLFLQNRLTLLLRAFPTTLEEDRALLQTKIGHVKAMLVRFRIIEKSVLSETLEFSKNRVKV